MEVPEIATGDVVIKNIAREAGHRTKLSVMATRSDIDPVGACVGAKNMRISSIINELNGEKVDIVLYSENPMQYITAALSPATVLHIEINEADKMSLVIVPDDKLSLAIGKNGQNVRLAARLTGWKIDVKAKSAVPSLEIDNEIEKDMEESMVDTENLFNDDGAFDDLE